MSPGLEMISAFNVSCGTRLAPRNSNPSITCPLGFATGSAACLGASSCGRCPCGVAGAGVGAGGCVVWGAAGIVSNGFALGGVWGGVCGALCGEVCGVAGGCCG